MRVLQLGKYQEQHEPRAKTQMRKKMNLMQACSVGQRVTIPKNQMEASARTKKILTAKPSTFQASAK